MISETQRAILEAGKQEFLSMGFQDASLRRIAKRAGVTTGAIYGYYADKAALFQALVEPTATDFKVRFIGMQEAFAALPPETQIQSMRTYSAEALQSFLDGIYAHYDAFRLLVCNAAGTAYEDYVESLVEIEAASTSAFLDLLVRAGYGPFALSDNMIHILASAYFSAIFETVAHGMDKVEADAYVAQITTFFMAGWLALFHL